MKQLLPALLGAILLAAGCARDETADTGRETRAQREPGHFLTRDEAAYRRRVIKEPEYTLFIDLERTPDSFAGAVEMRFTYGGGARPLTIDFRNGRVLSIEDTYDFITHFL